MAERANTETIHAINVSINIMMMIIIITIIIIIYIYIYIYTAHRLQILSVWRIVFAKRSRQCQCIVKGERCP